MGSWTGFTFMQAVPTAATGAAKPAPGGPPAPRRGPAGETGRAG